MVKIYKSEVPTIEIPKISSYDLIFTKNTNYNEDKIIYIDVESGATRTMGQLKKRVDSYAQGFYNNLKFLKRNDVVCMFSSNHLEYPALVHGLLRVNLTVTPANPTYQPDELAHQLIDSNSKAIFCIEATLPTVLKAAKLANIPNDKIFLIHSDFDFRDKKLAVNFRSLLDIRSSEPIPKSVTDYTLEDICNKYSYLCYSSGTTGKSKGVMSSQYNMVSNCLQIVNSQQHFDGKEKDGVVSGILPMFHIYGLQFLLHVSLVNPYVVLIYKRFDLEEFVKSIDTYKMTYAVIVPPIVVALAKYQNKKKFDLSSLKMITSGAAPLGGELATITSKKYRCSVVQGYGMTESSPCTLLASKNDKDPSSCGRLVCNVEARIVDPSTGKDVERGELWLKGPNIMLGYLNNAKATKETIDSDGWLHTGDVAECKGSHFYIVDRIKELIKYKGFQVAPAELEAHLQANPEIADAAVIGHPDYEAGELPRAYVVLRKENTLTARQVRDYVDAKVGATKRLRGGVIFVKSIPKSASGKIIRRNIRESDKEIHYLSNGSMYDYVPSKL